MSLRAIRHASHSGGETPSSGRRAHSLLGLSHGGRDYWFLIQINRSVR
jgi:hypothetical protein